MPYLNFTNLVMAGALDVKIRPEPSSDPEFLVSEKSSIANAARSFGYTMSSDGNKIIVGAYSASKAYVYEYDGSYWSQSAELVGTGRFGFKVAIYGDWAAVTETPTSGNGRVFMYKKNDGFWPSTATQTISVPAGNTASGFGYSVAIDSTTMVIGHTKANSCGGAHIYELVENEWIKQGDLITVTADHVRNKSNQNLGGEVSIHGNTIVVGGSGDTLGKGNGVAFITQKVSGSWTTPVMVKPDTTYADGFGWSVRARSNSVIVGAPLGNATDGHSGRAYLYSIENGSPTLTNTFLVKRDQSQIISDPLMATADSFGWSVDINSTENVVVIGAMGRKSNTGIVYAYEKLDGSWKASQISDSWLTASTASNNARFGSALGFVRNGVMIAAYGNATIYWFE